MDSKQRTLRQWGFGGSIQDMEAEFYASEGYVGGGLADRRRAFLSDKGYLDFGVYAKSLGFVSEEEYWRDKVRRKNTDEEYWIMGDSQSTEGFQSLSNNWYDTFGDSVKNVYAQGAKGLKDFVGGTLDAPLNGLTHQDFINDNGTRTLLMYIGTNDLNNAGFPCTTEAQVNTAVSTLTANIDTVVADCRTAGMKVVISKLMPFKGFWFWDYVPTEAWIITGWQNVNAHIESLRADDVIVVDPLALTVVADYQVDQRLVANDELHWNDRGRYLFGTHMRRGAAKLEHWNSNAKTALGNYSALTEVEQDAMGAFIVDLDDTYSSVREAYVFGLTDDGDQYEGIKGNTATTSGTVTNQGADGISHDTAASYTDLTVIPQGSGGAGDDELSFGVYNTAVPDVDVGETVYVAGVYQAFAGFTDSILLWNEHASLGERMQWAVTGTTVTPALEPYVSDKSWLLNEYIQLTRTSTGTTVTRKINEHTETGSTPTGSAPSHSQFLNARNGTAVSNSSVAGLQVFFYITGYSDLDYDVVREAVRKLKRRLDNG